MENFFDNRRLLTSIWNWKFHIIIASIIAVIGGAFFSSQKFIDPKYKSTARIYPVNLRDYSEESESEQLLELIRTNDVKFQLIDAFNLYDVYGIDQNDPLHITYILDEFNKNVSFKKTEFETIEIKVLDTDPNRAAAMADSAIVFYNNKIKSVHKAKYWEAYEVANNNVERIKTDIADLESDIQEIRDKYGIISYELQTEAATTGLMDAAARGGNSRPAQEKLKSLQSQGGKLKELEDQIKIKNEVLKTITIERDQAYMHATKDITYFIKVESPFPADKKSYPVRWLIVFFSLIITLFVSIITVLVLDYIRDTNQAK